MIPILRKNHRLWFPKRVLHPPPPIHKQSSALSRKFLPLGARESSRGSMIENWGSIIPIQPNFRSSNPGALTRSQWQEITGKSTSALSRKFLLFFKLLIFISLVYFKLCYADSSKDLGDLRHPLITSVLGSVHLESELLSQPEEDVFSDDVEVDPPFDVYTPAPDAPLPKENPLTVNLKNPVFVHGVISTDDGGVISAPGIRIQAQKMQYFNKIENGVQIQKIIAEKDLMMEYAQRIFVGDRLEYDFINRTGTLWNGKTFIDMWFLGGDKIELKEDGTFYILMLSSQHAKLKKIPGKSERKV